MRVYRTLLLLYPRSFRLAYGEDMVAVFEEMRRDRSPAALWWRVINDAFKSVIVQRLETLMSKESNLRPLGFAALAAVVILTVAFTGANNLAVFAVAVVVAGGAAIAALVYWQANRTYVEPSDQLHRFWLRTLAIGAGLIALVNIGSGFDIEAPWLVLFPAIIAGIMLVAVGLILGVWHAVARLRPASA